MTARTFGKKRVDGDGGDAVAARREAFVAAERARADRVAESDVFSPAGSALRANFAALKSAPDEQEPVAAEIVEEAEPTPFVPIDRSLPVTYAIWLILGLAGGHRFYLARPFTGAAQFAIFAASVGAVAGFQYYPAFAGLLLSWLWFFADGLRLRNIYRQETGK